jgi:hypothetical protein
VYFVPAYRDKESCRCLCAFFVRRFSLLINYCENADQIAVAALLNFSYRHRQATTCADFGYIPWAAIRQPAGCRSGSAPYG